MFLRQMIWFFALCILFGTELCCFFPHQSPKYCVLFNGSKYIVPKIFCWAIFIESLCKKSVGVQSSDSLSIAFRLSEGFVRLIYRGKQWAAPIHIAPGCSGRLAPECVSVCLPAAAKSRGCSLGLEITREPTKSCTAAHSTKTAIH